MNAATRLRPIGELPKPGDAVGHDDETRNPLLAWMSGYVAPVLPQPAPVLPQPAPGAARMPPPVTIAPQTGVISVDLTDDIEMPGGFNLAALNVAASTPKTGTTASASTTPLLTSYTSPGNYNVNIVFQGSWTSPLQSVFVAAANRISQIITADVPDVIISGVRIDDIRITATLAPIDGVGGILGQAGPTALRTDSYLPATAMMKFDSADAQAFYNKGLFDEIVTHEMLHSIGFGSIWGYKGLVSGASFIGANAMAEYDKLIDAFKGFDNGVNAVKVPLETGGGAGTAGSHWSESVFKNELMTGYINSTAYGSMVEDPISRMTIASLKDLGYSVDMTKADFYKLT